LNRRSKFLEEKAVFFLDLFRRAVA
jgi:hypothetical protein